MVITEEAGFSRFCMNAKEEASELDAAGGSRGRRVVVEVGSAKEVVEGRREEGRVSESRENEGGWPETTRHGNKGMKTSKM